MTLVFDDIRIGDELPPHTDAVDRARLVRYAGASGDFNPIHWNEEFASSVGLPGVIAHGMLTMAVVARAVSAWAGGPAGVRRLRVQFRREVRPGETIRARGRVVEKDEAARTIRLELWAELDRGGQTLHPIRGGEALVELR